MSKPKKRAKVNLRTMSVIQSRYPGIELYDLPIHTIAFAQFQANGDKIALVDALTGKQYTYKEVLNICQRVGSGLAKLGLQKGDRVSLFSYNTVEWFFIYWGVLCAGGTVTTVNPSYTKYELVNHLKDSGAKFLFTVKDMVDVSKAACSEVPGVKNIICSCGSSPGCVPFEKLQQDDGSLWPELEKLKFQPSEDLALIPYSSGTTGLPKGVMLTHHNVVAMIQIYTHPDFMDPARAEAALKGHQDAAMIVLPLYHVYGLVGLMILGMVSGAKLIVLQKFEPKLFLGTIEKYKINFLPLVPPLIIFLAKSPLVKQYDLSSVERVNSGAAPLSGNVEEELMRRLHITQMTQGFGMTETTLAVLGFGVKESQRLGACGRLLPATEGKIVDAGTGKVLGPNERGELLVRGPQIMKGYLNNPQATREMLDKEGFLHTGDIGYYDNDGYFFIVDRMKELIKVKGLQVAPAELEALLLSHPKVADVGVVGIPDERAGELPKAFIVKRPSASVTEQELQAYVGERLAPHKQLKGGIQFITEIPRLPSGKIIRRKLKEMAVKSRM